MIVWFSDGNLVDNNKLLISHASSGIVTTIFMYLLSFFIGIGSSITAHAGIKSGS